MEGIEKIEATDFDIVEKLNLRIKLLGITEIINNNQSISFLDTGKIYKVQLATSSDKIPTLPENFNGLKDVEVYISGKFYKYTYGLSPNMSTINEKLAMAKIQFFKVNKKSQSSVL